jgi:hypothetical protein
MSSHATPASSLLSSALSISLLLLLLPISTPGQNTVTGAFEGVVTNILTKEPVGGAVIRFINQLTGIPTARRSDAQGRFYQGLLAPGTYRVEVIAPGYKPFQSIQTVFATRTDNVQPLPIGLEPALAETATPTPAEQVQTAGVTKEPPVSNVKDEAVAATITTPEPQPRPEGVGINMTDARRAGAFTEREVSTLPLGAVTLVRTFDELALLLPGVTLPPQTQGNVAGPGVGAGVGSAGQFSVNGLRSRANNFTVDGSDNNDEDIGVRRQGFLSLVPQPIESIQEYQVITLLAPAEYGRNIGAQVNAVSKSGGSEHHGTIYGFFNASQLNTRSFFDNVGGNTTIPLQGRVLNPELTLGGLRNVLVDGQQKFVTNSAGDKDSFTLGQVGFVAGGPLIFGEGPKPKNPRWFYFVSAEKQILNATEEENFAVPTVEERGLLRTGATGFGSIFPTSLSGDAVFSLFPFPNNPGGVYERNTFTQELPASGEGIVLSGKVDGNFDAFGRPHQFTARYNFTEDQRDIPVTGGALFSSLRPRVQTQNFSTFLNSRLSSEGVTTSVFNQLRASYGRTRLGFDELRDIQFLIPSEAANLFPPKDRAFLLNAPVLFNVTQESDANVLYQSSGFTTEELINSFFFVNGRLAPVGQINISGFSPVGVDVFNFPQRRVNNTYQLADTVTINVGNHNLAFGTDLRRTELNSELPRNFRPLITFNGAQFSDEDFPVLTPADLAATGVPGGVLQTLTRGNDSAINLRYYQLNFFGQDEWRVRRNLSLSFGLRYEYNTPPREANDRIERAFRTPLQSEVVGLARFIEGRTEIFDPDRNNFAPRVGIAYAPRISGDHLTVFRAGFGVFYDQALGAVVSQSRSVFPNFLPVNFAGGLPDFDFDSTGEARTGIFLPAGAFINCGVQSFPLLAPGTLNTLNPGIPFDCFLEATENIFPGGFQITLPGRRLEMPTAYHFSATVEQQINRSMVFSAAYVGTRGRHLLRHTTPNLGPNVIVEPVGFDVDEFNAIRFFSITSPPGGAAGRPVANAGAVNIYTSDANSRYDALQLQLRGRSNRGVQYQAAYTFSKAEDDASDIFDLAGAPALPQNSQTFTGERGPSNFDVRHRFTYNVTYTLPSLSGSGSAARAIFGGLELASTGQFYTGQPFTVNSIYDRNLDGNLTDRLDNTNGLVLTGDRRQPIRLNNGDTFSLLAPLGASGRVGRNSFRAGNLFLINLAVVKQFRVTESHRVTFRAEVFNLTNRANFGIPVRFLEAPGFGQATDTVTPGRRVQFALKYHF